MISNQPSHKNHFLIVSFYKQKHLNDGELKKKERNLDLWLVQVYWWTFFLMEFRVHSTN
jgi:hypothetical protein